MKQYFKGFERTTKNATNYTDLLEWVAIPLAKRLQAGGKELHITLGCMTTGGMAAKWGIPMDDMKNVYDINIEVFSINQELIGSSLNEDIMLFDQTIFEDTFRRIDNSKNEWDFLISKFYWPLFEEIKFKKIYLQPYWQGSRGTRQELFKLKDLDVEIYELPEGCHELNREEFKMMFEKLQPVSKEYLEDTIDAVVLQH